MFRIASYNLQKCVGLDLRRRPGRSLKVIAALDAQLIVLQEADKRIAPRNAALPHDMVEAAGWRIVPFGNPGGSLGWHGNAMLLRGDTQVIETAHLELPGLEPRGAIRADLDTPIGPLRVVGMHLGLMRRHRLLQLSAIMRNLAQLPPRPTVLAGDFNDWSDGRALQATIGALHLQDTPPSFPSPRAIARLDRFAIDPSLHCMTAGVHTTRPARVASDHLPVWMDLALPAC